MSKMPRKSRSRASAPKWLVGRSPREIWAMLERELIEIRFFQATDSNVLGRYCKYMSEWIALTEILDRDGATYTTSSPHVEEMVRVRPEFRMRKALETDLRDLEKELGLTPSARFSISARVLAQKAPSPPQADLPLPDDPRSAALEAKEEWESILGGGRAH